MVRPGISCNHEGSTLSIRSMELVIVITRYLYNELLLEIEPHTSRRLLEVRKTNYRELGIE